MMSTIKTKPHAKKVSEYLKTLDFEREFVARQLIDIMREVTGEQPVMWGPTIVGFGTMRYRYASGKDAEWLRIGFSARKGKTSLYLTQEAEQYLPMLEELGVKYSIGKGCIYLHKFDDIDIDELRQLIGQAVEDSKDYEVEQFGVTS